jgi:hydroxymethylpyrimidine pyrophosphatase-like HAD family hydrolase
MQSIPLLASTPAATEALARVRVLYSDLDGTLLGVGGSLLTGGEGQPSLATARAVMRINQAGLDVVIATGRNRIQTAEIARLLGWRGFIAELGCVIVPDRGSNPVYYTGDWPDGLLEPGDTPFALIERAGALSALMRAFPGRVEPHAPYHLDREATHVLRGLVDVHDAKAVLDTLEVPVEIIDNGIIHPVATDLAELPEIHAYHLIPAGVTKAGAVAHDMARRGVTARKAAAIGDSATDVEMADVVSLAVVVANACDDERVDAKASARGNVYATQLKRGDGWAEFAEIWLKACTGADALDSGAG